MSEAEKHANALMKVAAFLATQRIQGWANPLVADIVDAANYLSPVERVEDKGDATLSGQEHQNTQSEVDDE